jgi:uncharacterized cupredoxin-like copper-binding protein
VLVLIGVVPLGYLAYRLAQGRGTGSLAGPSPPSLHAYASVQLPPRRPSRRGPSSLAAGNFSGEARVVNRAMAAARLAALGGAAAVALSGCGGTSQPAGSHGPGMMGGSGGTGYTYSQLSCSAPRSLPGRTVTVMLADMGMNRMMAGTAPLGAPMMLRAVPATVPAGQISLVAENMGWRTHELVILPLQAGSPAGQRIPGLDGKVDESGSLGEASASCAAGSGEGISARAVGWTTVTLPPGRYELVCNLPNHYANGMHQELDVTSG